MFTKEHAEDNKLIAEVLAPVAEAMSDEQLYDTEWLRDGCGKLTAVLKGMSIFDHVNPSRIRHRFYVAVGKERGRRIRERDNVSHA